MSGKPKEQQQQQQQVPGYAKENDAERAEYLARQLAIAHQEKEAAVKETLAAVKEKDEALIQLQILIRREKDVARREKDIQRQETRIAQQLREMTLKKACYHLCVYIVVVLSL